MERNIQRTDDQPARFTRDRSCWISVARYANSLAGMVCVLFMGLGLLVAAVSWFQMRLEEKRAAGKAGIG